MAGIKASVVGKLADAHGIDYVYWMCVFFPAAFLLDIERPSPHRDEGKLNAD